MTREVCHRPLDVLTDGEGNIQELWHASGISLGPAHDPVPVPRVEALAAATTVCDFCSTPGGAWRFPARTFSSRDLPLTLLNDYRGLPAELTPKSVGDWMSCDVCHADILANRWEAIATRATRAQPSKLRPMMKDHIRKLHRQFRANRTGDPIRISIERTPS